MKKAYCSILLLLLSVSFFAISIYDIQFTTDPSGNSTLEGQDVTVSGIVTAIGYYSNNDNRFFISSPEGGVWNGIYIFNSDAGIQIGDEVSVFGTVVEYFDFTEISSATINVLSSGNPIPAPVEISTSDLNSEEMYESVLVKINNVNVVQTCDSYGQWYVDDGSGNCQIDDPIVNYGNPQIGDPFLSITGVVDYAYSEFGLNPRTISDFEQIASYDLSFGSDETFDIMTWNIEHFPKNGQITIDKIAEIIETLDVDFIALQEIEDENSFNDLVDALDGWDGFRANSAFFDVNLAYLFKTNEVTVTNTCELFTNDSYIFPRSPLVAEIVWNNTEFYIINNHLKAMEDSESEERRRQACNGLKNHIEQYCSELNVILLGDLNDSLTDPDDSNVFNTFLEDEDYEFADMGIATGSPTEWSFPSNNPAHFDHILLTDEVFDIFDDSDSEVKTIKAEMYMDGGWNSYDDNISDHRPVALKLDVFDNVYIEQNVTAFSNFISMHNYPNPFNPNTTISFELEKKGMTEVSIFNIKGQIVKTLLKEELNVGEHKLFWNGTSDTNKKVPTGVYFYKITNNKKHYTKKMILIK